MNMFDKINESLPLEVSHAVWTGDILTISGPSWSLSTAGAWRLRNSERVRIACFDSTADAEVEKLVGRTIVMVQAQSSEFPVDPCLVLDNGELLEIFSADTYEPWTWTLRSSPVWVAAPGDPAWVSNIKNPAGER